MLLIKATLGVDLVIYRSDKAMYVEFMQPLVLKQDRWCQKPIASSCRTCPVLHGSNLPLLVRDRAMITEVHLCDRVDQLPLFPYNRGWETQPKSVGVYRAP